MRILVLNPWGVLYEGNAAEALLPGEDGELCVLDFHHPFLARLRRGSVQILGGWRQGQRVRRRPMVEFRMLVRDGIARMTGNELVILADS